MKIVYHATINQLYIYLYPLIENTQNSIEISEPKFEAAQSKVLFKMK